MSSNIRSGFWYRCRDFVEEQSSGEWDDKTIADDADKLLVFVLQETRHVKIDEALRAARLQIKTLGTPDDAINNAVLKLIDGALAS